MKIRKLLLNFAIGLSALFFGLAWVSVYQFFLDHSEKANTEISSEKIVASAKEAVQKPNLLIETEHSQEYSTEVSDDIENEDETNYTEQEKFLLKLEIEGYYASIKETSDSLTDISMEIWLGDYDENFEKWVVGAPNGHFEINNKTFEFEKFHYSHGRLYFSTNKINGISYEFKGVYNKRKIPGGEFDNELLDGELTKQKNGKTIKTDVVAFVWGIGC